MNKIDLENFNSVKRLPCPAFSTDISTVHNWPSHPLILPVCTLYNMMYSDCNIVGAGDVPSMDDLTLSGDIICDDGLQD